MLRILVPVSVLFYIMYVYMILRKLSCCVKNCSLKDLNLMLFLYYVFFVISVVFHFGFEVETVVYSLLFIFQLTPAV